MARNIFRKELADVRPYIPGKPIEEVRREYGLTRIEKLASNENPLGPSPMAIEAMRKELANVNLYPDPTAADLRSALAAEHGLSPDNFIVSNGGEHLLQILAQVFINEGDEAYYDYARVDPDYPDGVDLLKRRKNTIVLRTFSKIAGIAGVRVAYLMSSPEIIREIAKIRGTFCVNRLAQAAALASLADKDHTAKSVKLNAESIGMMNDFFKKKKLEYIESRSNFVFVNTGKSSKEIFESLMRRGVIIRPGYIWGWDAWIRVSSGTREQTRYFIENFEAAL